MVTQNCRHAARSGFSVAASWGGPDISCTVFDFAHVSLSHSGTAAEEQGTVP